jgi:hypothetical protein
MTSATMKQLMQFLAALVLGLGGADQVGAQQWAPQPGGPIISFAAPGACQQAGFNGQGWALTPRQLQVQVFQGRLLRPPRVFAFTFDFRDRYQPIQPFGQPPQFSFAQNFNSWSAPPSWSAPSWGGPQRWGGPAPWSAPTWSAPGWGGQQFASASAGGFR